jgi:2'-5' RNA ligase
LPEASLYFLALLPPNPIAHDVQCFKEVIAEKFQSKAALRSPPHITLHMPFRWPESKLQRLSKVFDQFFSKISWMEVRVNGFGAFTPRVIYINVESSPDLTLIQQQLSTLMSVKLSIYNSNYKNRPFRPHMTIGFRDLQKPMFYQAWEYFEHQTFEATFRVNEVTLLKHNGLFWEPHSNFSLSSAD